ncbi:MAG: carboxypeptidase-like regulatory domain-containing protein, partial [Bacteroidales bacterium]|nr:carboxypeptidase-like regulatory domain-containing protein [Bacteroidales bacterium]
MNRKTIVLMMILILSLFPGKIFAQQEDVFLKKVGIDSLMTFLKKDFSSKIYYIKDTSDIVKYSVKASKDEFLKEAFRELKFNGYTVTEYDGAFYVLKDFGFSTKLPTAYFEKQDSLDLNRDFLNYLNTKNTVVTFQNKIYEIGDISSEKSGKAYVSGYVRDVLTGEPITGVSVFEEKAKTYVQTDAYGFYKIMLPIGQNKLCFTGYSLEDANLNLIVYDNGGLDVAMKEKVFSLTGAVISSESTANHRSNKIGIEKVRISRIKHIPAVFGEADVIKVVLTLPGVKSVGEASSGFNVRGGSTDQNLILFNDGTIYNPS